MSGAKSCPAVAGEDETKIGFSLFISSEEVFCFKPHSEFISESAETLC
jgi:hypothetical protein